MHENLSRFVRFAVNVMDVTDDEIREMTRKCSRDFTATYGQLKVLTAADMEAIYHMAR